MLKLKMRGIDQELKNVLKQFSVQKDKIVSNSVQKLKLELVDETPIDTGLARASWKVIHTSGIFSGTKYHIVNTTEYIKYLNQGSSKQAPPFFIEKTALRYGKPVGTIVDVK